MEMNVEAAPVRQRRLGEETGLYLWLCFVVPAVVLTVVFAVRQVFPFGDQQILIIDFYQQHYPFAVELQRKLQQGGSLLWSWNVGLGTNFLSLYAYYLSSPFGFLTALVPTEYLREALTLFVVLKIGFAGLFCGVMLRRVYGKNDLSLVVFATLYALCGYVLGYYWNYVWLDSFAVLPLVFWGQLSLLRERRFRLYTLSLALAIWLNLLIGLYICIFVGIMFFVLCIADRVSVRDFFRRLGRIACFSALALGMAAVLILPTMYSLEYSFRVEASFPAGITWHASLLDTLGNFAPLATSTSRTGLSNVYTGMLGVMLFGAFLLSGKSTLRQKILATSVLLFLLLSVLSAQLDFIWNGFKNTLQLPGRYSFMISFVLVLVGFKAYHDLEKPSPHTYTGMLVMALLVAVCAGNGPQSEPAVWACFVAACLYVLGIALYQRGLFGKNVLSGILLALVVLEVGLTANIGIEAATTTPRDTYPNRNAQIIPLIAQANDDAQDGFFRMETSRMDGTINDPAMYGYHGANLFVSMINDNVVRFMQGIGSSGHRYGLRYVYNESTPLINNFLAMQYYITREKPMIDPDVYWEQIGANDGVRLYKNKAPLGLGFMVDRFTTDYESQPGDPFASQNLLMMLAADVEGQLFDLPIDMHYVSHVNLDVFRHDLGKYTFNTQNDTDDATLKWNYKVPEAGLYYAYVDIDHADYFHVMHDGSAFPISIGLPYVTPIGYFEQDDELTILSHVKKGDTSGNATVYLRRLNEDVYREGYARLADEPLVVTAYTDTEVQGTVHALRDGLLYTSIPYEKGWRAYVDGREADITPLADAMLCVPIPAGEHTVRFAYVPEGLWLGTGISLGSAALLVVASVLDERRRRRMPAVVVAEEETVAGA